MADNALLEQMRTIIREEIKAETEPMKQALTRIEQKLEREVTDLAEHIGEMMTRLDTRDNHETRIRQLEEDSEFPRSH
jgi:DNA-binding transcriptional regulator GbsR (MarR family)